MRAVSSPITADDGMISRRERAAFPKQSMTIDQARFGVGFANVSFSLFPARNLFQTPHGSDPSTPPYYSLGVFAGHILTNFGAAPKQIFKDYGSSLAIISA